MSSEHRPILRDPSDVESRYALAKFLNEGSPDEAVLPLYEQVVQERPGWADAQHSLGWMYGMKLQRFPEGIEHLILATQLEPDDYSHWYALGAVYWNAGQLLDAREAFQQSLARIILPREEYMRGNITGYLGVLNRRLIGDFRPVYPRR